MKTKFLFCLTVFAASGLGEATILTADSINCGWDNHIADGSNSLILGDQNWVSSRAFALGWNNDANLAFAVGLSNIVSNYSIAVGNSNHQSIDSVYSMAVGHSNTIDGASQYSSLLGYQNTLQSQDGSFVAGIQNRMLFPSTKDGLGNVLLGEYNTLDLTASSGTHARSTILMGYENSSSESKAYAIGIGNIGQSETVTLGKYAATVSNASLIVGNGTNAGNRTNALVVLKDGTVQIPNGALQIAGQNVVTQSSLGSQLGGYLTQNGYMRSTYGTGAVSNGAILALGNSTIASADSAMALGVGTHASGSVSLAIGNNTTAAGSTAMASGSYTTASGHHSFAAGYFSNASGNTAMAMGNHATASGNYSMAINSLTQSNGVSSFAMGNNSRANGDESFAGGRDSIASGLHSFAMGQGSTALGNDSIALGLGNKAGSQAASFGWGSEANGQCSFAAGRLAIANKGVSIALGEGTSANSHGETVMGMYNSPVAATYLNGFNPVEAILEVGNGSSASDRSNAVTVLKNGKTTLKNKAWVSTTPTEVPQDSNWSNGEALSVEGHAVMKGNTTLKGNTVLEGRVTLAQPQGDISMGVYQ